MRADGVLVAPQLVGVLLAFEGQAHRNHGVGNALTEDAAGLLALPAGGIAGVRGASADLADTRAGQQGMDEEVGVAGGQPDDGCHPGPPVTPR